MFYVFCGWKRKLPVMYDILDNEKLTQNAQKYLSGYIE